TLSAAELDFGRAADRGRTAGGTIVRRHTCAQPTCDPEGRGRHILRQGVGSSEPSRRHSQRQHHRQIGGGQASSFVRREKAVRRYRACLSVSADARLPLPADDRNARCARLRIPRRRSPAYRSRLACRLPGQPADEKGDEAQFLPSLHNGDIAQLEDPKIEDKETRPPPRYNEGTLIEAMQNAWRFVEDGFFRERLKEAKGMGTPATRAEIIGGLKKQSFLIAQGKNIVPTENGLSLFGVLKQADPALVDP